MGLRLFEGRRIDILFADICARFGETAHIPRYMNSFCKKNQDRILYGTDMGFEPSMYAVTFLILEPMMNTSMKQICLVIIGHCIDLGLKDNVLKKIYGDNARRILNH